MASVISTNRFDFLNDDDTGDVANQTDASGSAKDKKQQQKNKKTTPTTTAARAKPTETRVKRDYPARGGRTTVSTSRSYNEGRDYETETRPPRPHRGGRGGRGSRGGRGGRGREFDRHSASGRVDSEKQINQGWGPVTSTFEDSDRTGDDINKKPDIEGEGPEPIPEEDQEPAVKTLDEYLAERAERIKIGSDNLPETRKANEGTDETKWRNAKQLDKGQDETIFFAGKSAHKSKGKKSGRGKVFVEIEQRFEETSHRGGRGGYRGGRGGGGYRGGRAGGQVSVDDRSAFPTLGA